MKRGFTLIELLIVIAILAILSTLGLSNFQSARTKASDLNRKSDLQTVAKSLEAYAGDHRAYPLTGTLTWGAAFTDPNGTIYVAKLPDNTNLIYDYESDGKTYTLFTHLNNSQDPTIFNPATGGCGSTCNYKITSTNK